MSFDVVLRNPGGGFNVTLSAGGPPPPGGKVFGWDGAAWRPMFAWSGTAWLPVKAWDGTQWI